MPSSAESPKRLGDRHRPRDGRDGRNGRDGKNGVDGKDGRSIKGDPGRDGRDGLNGKAGADGRDGQDAVLVEAEATFERDENKLATRVIVKAKIDGQTLLTIVPHRHGKEPMHSATITPR